MPAKSAAQQKAAGAAPSARARQAQGRLAQGRIQRQYELMSEKELDEMASTKRRKARARAWLNLEKIELRPALSSLVVWLRPDVLGGVGRDRPFGSTA